MEDLLLADTGRLLRLLAVGTLAYATLVFLLRISGPRTLAKMNAADFVVTIAIGSTLGTVLLDSRVTLSEGAVAFALLIGLQFIVTWTSVRFASVRQVMTGEPVMLAYRGATLAAEMRKVRVTEAEVLAALRSAGLGGVGEAQAVVLETDGSISVVCVPPR
mgnify:CR=1 FL=1